MLNARVPGAIRREVATQAQGYCEYCRSQERFSPDSFSVEHIIPLVKEGTSEVENLAFSCQGCNNRKFISTEAIDPLTGDLVALFHPRLQPWDDHFTWNETFTTIIGVTPTGRATVDKLQLNRSGLVNLRKILVELHEHP